ncbi:MAG: hypothetical protein IJZ82_03005 [Lachnospiraceae bacterium]|nr:hypothetical protein [Lachnospiraceae bacterium]
MKRRIIFAFIVCLGLLITGMLACVFKDIKKVAVLPSHRQELTPGIEPEIIEQFGKNVEVKKVYILLTNEWFRSEELSDFSQIVTNDTVYVIADGESGYAFYDTSEEGLLEWNGSAYPPTNVTRPFGFYGLAGDMIDDALVGMEYEDYIFTYSQRLRTVFIWVRGEKEDVIITYPTRPDLLGFEVGGVYNLEEVKVILSTAFTK